MNDNTKVKVRVPKKLYEQIKKKLDSKKTIKEEQDLATGSEIEIKEDMSQTTQEILKFLADNWAQITAAGGITALAAYLGKNVKDKSTVDSVTGYDR